MKRRITLTVVSAVFALAMMSISANSQNSFSGPRSMGTVLNSVSDDGNPVISPSGLSLYFASNRTGGLGGNDIWVSHRKTLNSQWGPPSPVMVLNSSVADTTGCISLDGKTIFLQSSRSKGGFGGRDIYMSTRADPNNDFGWDTPVNLGPVVNTNLDELAPSYFEDPVTGKASIIFGSDRVGIPSRDYHLYQSSRNTDGSFNPPTPISGLSLGGAEIRAVMRHDGLEVFISAILPQPGPSFDIWVSHRDSTTSKWSAPELVPAINSEAEERFVSLSPDGSILYFQSGRPGGSGDLDLYSVTRCSMYSDSPCGVNRAVSDFNGDGVSDISVFRPSDGNWYIMESGTNTFRAQHFGQNGDKIVPGDYDGDSRLDLAIFRPSTGAWWILPSTSGLAYAIPWGITTDKPAPGDYDGDSKTDLAVFRNGAWYILQSSNGQLNVQQFGLAGDIPVAE
jgi:hypothetical protein